MRLLFVCVVSVLARVACPVFAESEFVPDQSALPVPPPEEAIVLFSADQENRFLSKSGEPMDWKIEGGALISTRGEGRSNHLVSTYHFRDADIHVEFLLPKEGSGNSGVYIHGNYELQIINSAGKKDLSQQDMGAVYGFNPPLLQAALKPGQWQVYDIRYHAPRRNEQGEITKKGRITAWLNGQKVQDGTEIGEPRSTYHPYRYNTTPYLKKIWEQQKASSVGPVFLQDHDSPVRFRNVWVKPLDDLGKFYSPEENE